MSLITKQEAEKISGIKLDGRRKYYLYEGEVFINEKFTRSCTGCYEGGEYNGLAHNYPWDEKAQCRVGSGCEECGYTGKRVEHYPVPVKIAFMEVD